MSSLNKVFLIGNLTRDPELRHTPGGAAVCDLGMAMNRKYKSGDEWRDEVVFCDVTVWGKAGEACSQYLAKGRQVFVEGRLRTAEWETQDGQKRQKLEVVAEPGGVQFLGGKPRADPQRDAPAPEQQGDLDLDSIPF
jgi:single-strand DNA-binding protein